MSMWIPVGRPVLGETCRRRRREGEMLIMYPSVCGSLEPPDDSSRRPNSGLTLALSRTSSTLSQILPATSPRFADLAIGDRVEINKEGWEIMRMIGELIEGKVVDQERGERGGVTAADVRGAGGVGVVVDYGDEKAFDNSFRVRRRRSRPKAGIRC